MFARKMSLPMRPLVLIIATAILAFSAPALALAASGPWSSVNMTLIEGTAKQPVLLVLGALPANTTLPAKVSLPIPAGSTIGWVGEILGGDASKDPSVKYTVKAGKDYDLVEFTLTQARLGQVETTVQGAVTSKGGKTQASIGMVARMSKRSL